jgi:hypothetical protein
MIQNNAVTVGKISPNIISSIGGVKNDGGDIALVAGSNIAISPDDANNKITISASTGGGDNLGNHAAIQNIKLNGNWISNDGDDEGIFIKSNGNVGVGTNTPERKLSVKGNLDVNGFLIHDSGLEHPNNLGMNSSQKLGINSGTDLSLQAGSDLNIEVNKVATIHAGSDLNINVDNVSSIMSNNKIIIICGKSQLILESNGDITLQGTSITLQATMLIKLKAPRIDQN